jgi:nucleoside-diphosphate-sugar epimerase
MTVLVTGATGFVGSHVAEALAARGLRVRALVRPTADARALAAQGIEVAPGDVTDARSLARAAAAVDAVVHVAGLIRARDEAGFARANTFGARLVAEAAAAAHARRLLLVSSLSARGPEGASGPVSDYGRSKLAGERAALAACAGTATGLVIVRPAVVYGPRDRALLAAFRLARLGLRPVLRGAGSLSAIHGADLGRGLAALINAPPAPGAVLEASDGRSYTWNDLARAIGEAVGRPGPPLELSPRLFAGAAALTDAFALVSGVPQVFGRDKLAEMLGSWPAVSAPFWAAAGLEPRFPDFASGARDAARAYRDAGWL